MRLRVVRDLLRHLEQPQVRIVRILQSLSLSSARRSGYSMFDWPEQSQTSPTMTSSEVALAPPVPPTSIL